MRRENLFDATARELKFRSLTRQTNKRSTQSVRQQVHSVSFANIVGAGFGNVAMRGTHNLLAWDHPKGLALSEEQLRGTARFQTDNGGLHDRPRPVQATSATST
jgi:hypothetical protein